MGLIILFITSLRQELYPNLLFEIYFLVITLFCLLMFPYFLLIAFYFREKNIIYISIIYILFLALSAVYGWIPLLMNVACLLYGYFSYRSKFIKESVAIELKENHSPIGFVFSHFSFFKMASYLPFVVSYVILFACFYKYFVGG